MIKVYTRIEPCPFCDKAKKLLNIHEIPFTEFVIGKDVSRSWVHEAFPSMYTVPIIVDENRLIGGYDSLLNEITNVGFGKTLLQE
jgi:glutaredoxin